MQVIKWAGHWVIHIGPPCGAADRQTPTSSLCRANRGAGKQRYLQFKSFFGRVCTIRTHIQDINNSYFINVKVISAKPRLPSVAAWISEEGQAPTCGSVRTSV